MAYIWPRPQWVNRVTGVWMTLEVENTAAWIMQLLLFTQLNLFISGICCSWFQESMLTVILECHLGVLNFLYIFQYSSWCNHVMWLIGNSLPCCHGDQVVTGVPLHVTVATWWSCQSGTQPTRIQTCNSTAWTCIWFHNTNTIWIPQLCCVESFKSFYVGQNPSPIDGGRIRIC